MAVGRGEEEVPAQVGHHRSSFFRLPSSLSPSHRDAGVTLYGGSSSSGARAAPSASVFLEKSDRAGRTEIGPDSGGMTEKPRVLPLLRTRLFTVAVWTEYK